jgi:hypothetical protein
MCVNDAAAFELNAGVHHRKRPNLDTFAEFGVRIDDGARMYAVHVATPLWLQRW